MNIILNGKQQTLNGTLTLAALVQQLHLEGRRLAIEVNLEIIPRSQHDTYTLKENDRVEIVHAIGGGSS